MLYIYINGRSAGLKPPSSIRPLSNILGKNKSRSSRPPTPQQQNILDDSDDATRARVYKVCRLYVYIN